MNSQTHASVMGNRKNKAVVETVAQIVFTICAFFAVLAKTENVSIDFGEGDSIAVVAGVWKDTVGVVQKLDYGKQTATINVELFGRETPVEISFAEVRKL